MILCPIPDLRFSYDANLMQKIFSVCAFGAFCSVPSPMSCALRLSPNQSCLRKRATNLAHAEPREPPAERGRSALPPMLPCWQMLQMACIVSSSRKAITATIQWPICRVPVSTANKER